MFEQIEFFLLGFAAVVDTVLLLTISERVNRPRVPNWLLILVGSAWMWHTGAFIHFLLRTVDGPTALRLDQICMTAMSFALLLMPSGMMHAAIRVNITGLDVRPRSDLRYLALYLPLLVLPWSLILIVHGESRDFINSVKPLIWPYMSLVCISNIMAVVLFLRAGRSQSLQNATAFFVRLSGLLIVLTLAAILYLVVGLKSDSERWWRLAANLTPLLPSFLFVWYTLQQRLVPLFVERTLAYGGLLVVVFMFHRVTISQLTSAMQKRVDFDFIMVEVAILVALILGWSPLRRRVLESLRYLLSRNVAELRDATRRLSVRLSQEASGSQEELIRWVETAVTHEIGLEFVAVYLSGIGKPRDSSGEVIAADAVTARNQVVLIQNAMDGAQRAVLNRSDVGTGLSRGFEEVEAAMDQLHVMHAFRLKYQSVNGVVLLGPRLRSDLLNAEQCVSLALLFEQFAATLHNRHVELERLRAERFSMQKEKLSVLGLIAGSLAHELRNPLSSMRTITSLLLEDSTDPDQRQRDLKVILAEIDRLALTTQRLLDYSRPASESTHSVNPCDVIDRLLQILRQLARQHNICLETQLDVTDCRVRGTDAILSEVLFNLIRNGIEAVRSANDGRVLIRTSRCDNEIVVSITDNGPGIDEAVRDTMFQPFVTSKPDGTGLGLYVVAERVRELSGTICCHTSREGGTVFEVRLPVDISGSADNEDVDHEVRSRS
ncbi:MAG: hypothetical protein JNL58_22740 [Planctomyces sp.]|nr:hypothetical protein [Planctomyces sp.]